MTRAAAFYPLVCLLLLALPSAALADEKPQQIAGVVTSVDGRAMSITIKDDGAKQITVACDETTKFTGKDGKPSSLAAISKDSRVTVTATRSGDTWRASAIAENEVSPK